MKSHLMLGVAAFSAVIWAAGVPTVSNVQLVQDAQRRVIITYDLEDADAVVTVSLVTNGVAVSGQHLQGMQGDVAKCVARGTGRQIIWRPQRFWSEGGKISGEISVRVTAWPVQSPAPYLVVDLTGAKEHRYYASEDDLPGGISGGLYRTTKMVMRKIPAATVCFRAGSDAKEYGHRDAEAVHYATLTNDYYLAVFPLTQGQYLAIMGSGTTNRASSVGENLPMDNLGGSHVGFEYSYNSRYAAYSSDRFVGKVRTKTGFSDLGCPTQTEWEYACRGGDDSAPIYGGYALDEVAWYDLNSSGVLHPVGLKKPNPFGIYDMLGNVAERVNDAYSRSAFSAEVIDPCEVSDVWGSNQAMCGGSFASTSNDVRAAGWTLGSGAMSGEARHYDYSEPGFGMRLSLRLK